MKTGFDFLIESTSYNNQIVEDFEKVLGSIPLPYKEFIVKYKTGYPNIDKKEDAEVIAKVANKTEVFYIETFITLPEVMDKLFGWDRAYGLSGNHRKFRLLPICTSGSSYRVYFLNLVNGAVYYLNPNEDMEIELDLEKHKLANNLNDFIETFVVQ